MPAIVPKLLSGSTNGRPLLITATTSGGAQTVHTAVSGTTHHDEIYIYAHNLGASATKVTIEFGNATDTVEQTIQPEAGAVLVIPGWRLQNGLTVDAFADTGSVIELTGHVNRHLFIEGL